MSTISTDAFDFFKDLNDNNSKAWFEKNRKRYDEAVRKPMKALSESLTPPVSTLLTDFNGKPRISRINNDLRFHKNKPPYKEHMWIAFKGARNELAELFMGIGANGWSAGVGLHGPKKDDLTTWRDNILKHVEIWRAFNKAFSKNEKLEIHTDEGYKKPLYDGIPEDVYDLVQAKGVWIFTRTTRKFSSNPESDIFNAMCRILPVFFFGTISPNKLTTELSRFGNEIPAPDKSVEKVWGALR